MYQAPARRWSADSVDVATRSNSKNVNNSYRPAAIVPNADIFALLTLLSSREHEIAVLVARGLSNKEVAIELAISPWTVSAHLRRIFTKLDIKRRIELCLLMAQF